MKYLIALISLVVCTFGARTTNLGWKIVGGQEAENGQFPHQISLRYSGSHSCGGSILDENTILCAAHCVSGRDATKMTIVVGTNKLSEGGDVYQVDSYIRHPNYNSLFIFNDISLIKLATPIQFSDKIKPVELRQENIGGEEDCILSGWGRTSYPGSVPDDLQWIKLKTLSVEECAKEQPLSIASEVCTLTKAGEGACHGDSGGALLDAEGRQIGIVSYGNPCARGKPDVFTRVFSFLSWIEENRYIL